MITGELNLTMQQYHQVMGKYFRLSRRAQKFILKELIQDGSVYLVNKQTITIVGMTKKNLFAKQFF